MTTKEIIEYIAKAVGVLTMRDDAGETVIPMRALASAASILGTLKGRLKAEGVQDEGAASGLPVSRVAILGSLKSIKRTLEGYPVAVGDTSYPMPPSPQGAMVELARLIDVLKTPEEREAERESLERLAAVMTGRSQPPGSASKGRRSRQPRAR